MSRDLTPPPGEIAAFDVSPACWEWAPPTDADRERVRARDVSLAKYMGEQRYEEMLPSFLMIEWQQDRCAICGRHERIVGGLVEDHDHATGLVRGYLCRSCNTREGIHRYRADLRMWREYRERNPASICGVVERYYDPYTREFAEPEPPLPTVVKCTWAP